MSAPTLVPPTPPTPPTGSSGPTTVTTVASGAAVQGDGTTASSRARARWRRWRWPLLVVVVIALSGLLAAVLRPATTVTALAPDSTAPEGARALARVLSAHGVTVDYVRTSAEAAARAQAGTTLLVVGTYLLSDGQVEQIAATDADLVLVEPDAWVLEGLTDGALTTGLSPGRGPQPSACSDEDARAAGTVDSTGLGITGVGSRPVVCFTAPGDASTGAFATVQDGERRIAALDDRGLLTNARITEDGNAALLLRTLGRTDRLVWYLPSVNDTGGEAAVPTGDLLPEWAGPLGLQLAAVALALALWRGRALGRVVAEPLPVTVRAAEATRGRGRLYRRSRSRGHAAAALRAGTARRSAARLGLPRSAGAPAVIDALARATGRTTGQVADLLYGPPPTDDAGLLQLARALDELESEVHRT